MHPRVPTSFVRCACALVLAWWAAANGPRAGATVLWSDLGATLAHETGDGADILGGAVKRDDSDTNTLYFKFHIDPLSDASTEEYFAAFELFEHGEERLGVGNALKAWAYSAFKMMVNGDKVAPAFVDLRSSRPESAGASGRSQFYENPHRGLEVTIVFKVQYVAGGDDLVTIWLDPDLGPGASEASQPENLITRLTADASFDEIRLRHEGGGEGWIFSDMEIATSFADFVAGGQPENGPAAGFSPGRVPRTFRAWQREQGLPQNFVRALAQTRDGYLWVGGDDGVARFDGLRFVPFGLREGLKSGPVRALLGDSAGALWIGGVDGGLTRFYNGQFSVVTNLPSDAILALAEGESGELWIGSEAGLSVWRDGRLSDRLRGKAVTALARDAHGRIWAGVRGDGIFRIDKDGFARVSDPSVASLLQDPHCLLVDRQDRLWAGVSDEFVVCHEGARWNVTHIHPHEGKPYITSLAETPDGSVWAGSLGEGLFQLKGSQAEAMNARSGLSDNLVEALLVDQQGALWVGTHDGLNRQRAPAVVTFSAREGLGYGAVQGLAEVAPGVIWAGKPGDGLYRWEGRAFRRLSVPEFALAGQQVTALLRARDGSCWVAADHGLVHFKNPSDVSRQAEVIPVQDGEIVQALAQDREGAIWAGARQGSLWRRAGQQWQVQNHPWRSHAVTALVPDRDGSMLVGTQGAGVFRLHGAEVRHYTRKDGLLSDLIRTLALDSQGSLWIGTEGGGLSRIRAGKIASFTTREGLVDNTISQILEDDDGRLWLGSNRGIASVALRELDDLAEGRTQMLYPQVYGRDEGMLSEECASGFFPAGLKTRSGLLWFATLKGLAVTDPRQRSGNSAAPTAVLEQVSVDGVSNPLGGSPPLRLRPGAHRLELGYTAVCFDAPDRVRFRYRLEPLDADWFEAGTRRTASYPYVPPGAYRFVVSASVDAGNWGPPTALKVSVARFFWQTWWFRGATALAALASVAALARVVEKRKLQRRLRQLEQEKLLERERTRIAQDLHDEMGAKLCRISFLSENARRGPEIPSDVRSQIVSISDASREVLHSLDEIVWAVNPRNDSLEPVASYIGQYAQDYFQDTGIRCELEIPAHFPPYALSSQLRHHLFHAVHESFTNTLKHSRATRTRIAVKCSSSAFEIITSDNGAGFDLRGRGCAAGNGLRNMQERLAQVGGACHIESQPGSGVTVRFVIPLNGCAGTLRL